MFLVISLLVITGCGVADGGKVTAKEVLKQNPEADILQYNGFIYNNVTHVEWFELEKEKHIKHNLLGEIKNSQQVALKQITNRYKNILNK